VDRNIVVSKGSPKAVLSNAGIAKGRGATESREPMRRWNFHGRNVLISLKRCLRIYLTMDRDTL